MMKKQKVSEGIRRLSLVLALAGLCVWAMASSVYVATHWSDLASIRPKEEEWEELLGRRVTEDLEEAERDAWEDPLPDQLEKAIRHRGTTQRKLAQLFGVSQPAVNSWLTRKKPVPAELVPYVARWIATGHPPSAAELAQRKTRRTGS